jgi:hypothetical protein
MLKAASVISGLVKLSVELTPTSGATALGSVSLAKRN